MAVRPNADDLSQYTNNKVPVAGRVARAGYLDYGLSRLREMSKAEAKAWIDSGQHACEIAALMTRKRGLYKTAERARAAVFNAVSLRGLSTYYGVCEDIEKASKSR